MATTSEGSARGSKREMFVEQQCLKWLNENGWFAWKNPTVGVWDEERQAYRKPGRFQIQGASDAIAIKDGQVLFVEFKAAAGVQSEAQILFEKQIKLHGGAYLLVRSLGELQNGIRAFAGVARPT